MNARLAALAVVVAISGAAAIYGGVGHAAPARTTRAAYYCGTERAVVKHLADRPVLVSRGRSSVLALGRLRPPSPLPELRSAQERRIYTITARLDAFKMEADNDVHLAVAGVTSDATMIVELPADDCMFGAAPKYRTQASAALTALLAACGRPNKSRFKTLGGKAQIRGVLFFDRRHGQRNLAPNGVELHPVLGFRAYGACR